MRRVLIIDDEPWSREVVKSLGEWRRLKLEVVGEAEDGTSGLKAIEELRPDIVVTDMRMPGLDGAGLLKAMNEKFPALKIIVVSGYDDFVYLKQAIASRAADYLLKPLDPNELNAALEKCAKELDAGPNGAKPERIPFVFEDPGERDRYLQDRRQLRSRLLELDKQGVLDTLNKLGAGLLEKIGQDLVLILEEFASENGIPPSAMPDLEAFAGDGASESIAHAYGETLEAVLSARRHRSRLDMAEVAAFIDRHYQDAISLDTVAHFFYVSKEHLSRSFKSYAGINMSEYILRAKMNKAKELIEDGLSIRHAAELTGYSDVPYFYRVFKKHFGFNPGQLAKTGAADQQSTREQRNILE